MTRTLTIALCALTLSTPTFAHSPSEAAKVYATMPAGDGNPDAISCYPEQRAVTRIATKVCKTNAEWARNRIALRKQCLGCEQFPNLNPR